MQLCQAAAWFESRRHSKLDAGLRRREAERRVGVVRRPRRARVDRRLRRGGVDGPGARRGRWRPCSRPRRSPGRRTCGSRRRRSDRSSASCSSASRRPGSSRGGIRSSLPPPRRTRTTGWCRWSCPSGPESIAVWGGVVSTVKVRDAGVASVFPTASVARTSNVWEPSREARVGLRGGAALPGGGLVRVEATFEASRATPRRRTRTTGWGRWSCPMGPESIVVCGGTASTVQVRTVGLGSGFPAASTARTRKV